MSEEQLDNIANDVCQENAPNYSLYNFLKHNSSAMYASISAIVAVIAAILRVGSYLYHIAYLKYWNIDPGLISQPEIYWLENIALSFALLISSTMLYSLLNETNATLKHHMFLLNNEKKHLKEVHQKIKNMKNKLKKFSSSQVNKQKIENLSSKIKKMENEFSQKKMEIRSTRAGSWLNYIAHVLIIMITFGLVFYIVILQYADSLKQSLMFAISVVVLIYIMISTGAFLPSSKSNQELNKKYKDIITRKHMKEKYEFPMFPISKIKKRGIKHFLSNQQIFSSIITLAIFLILFLVYASCMGEAKAKEINKKIPIITIDSESYAILSNDSDCIITERIEITGNDATIYVNEQLVVPKESVRFKLCHFDKVLRQMD